MIVKAGSWALKDYRHIKRHDITLLTVNSDTREIIQWYTKGKYERCNLEKENKNTEDGNVTVRNRKGRSKPEEN
jgi:hypothetical protein